MLINFAYFQVQNEPKSINLTLNCSTNGTQSLIVTNMNTSQVKVSLEIFVYDCKGITRKNLSLSRINHKFALDPTVSIQDSRDSNDPSETLRTDIQTFNANPVLFDFPGAYTPSYSWTIYEINSTTQSVIRQVDLSANPTSATMQLKLLAKTLTYGLFRVSFQFTATMTNPDNSVSSQKSSTYVLVKPSGFIVASLPNDISSFKIGTAQSLTLNPAAYSYDLDSLANMSLMSYVFYCMRVNRSQSGQSFLSQPGVINLATAKQNSILSTGSCFNSTGLFAFHFL